MLFNRREFIEVSLATAVSAAFPPVAFGAADRSLKILFLGGTGFLGPHTVKYALQRGHEVTLFNRGRTNADMFPELETIIGNRDPEIDEGLSGLEGREWDAVIDTSGYVPRITGASAGLLAESVGQYLFVSTICQYDNWAEGGMNGTEDRPRATLDDPTTEDVSTHYCALKAYCERAVEDAMPGRVTQIRPGLIVGPRDGTDRFTYWPARIDAGGEVLGPDAVRRRSGPGALHGALPGGGTHGYLQCRAQPDAYRRPAFRLRGHDGVRCRTDLGTGRLPGEA